MDLIRNFISKFQKKGSSSLRTCDASREHFDVLGSSNQTKSLIEGNVFGSKDNSWNENKDNCNNGPVINTDNIKKEKPSQETSLIVDCNGNCINNGSNLSLIEGFLCKKRVTIDKIKDAEKTFLVNEHNNTTENDNKKNKNMGHPDKDCHQGNEICTTNSSKVGVLKKLLENENIIISKVNKNLENLDANNNRTAGGNINPVKTNTYIPTGHLCNKFLDDNNNNEDIMKIKHTLPEVHSNNKNSSLYTKKPEALDLEHIYDIKTVNNVSPLKNKHLQFQDNDETNKCLNEFDDILNKVQIFYSNSENSETQYMLLDEIDDILSLKLNNFDNTYNFQEIEQSDIIELTNPISHNSFDENNDVISLTSDDSKGIDIQNLTDIGQNIAVVNDTLEHELGDIGVIKNIETIPLRSSNLNINNIDPSNLEVDGREISTFHNFSQKNIIETKDAQSEEDCGYNSSDFEFITEDEAKANGIIINVNPLRHTSNLKYPDKAKYHIISNACSATNRVQNDPYGPGPSRNPRVLDNYKENMVITDKKYVENYAVPEENEFLKMFHGQIPALPLSEIHFLENKSVRTRAPMLVQFEGIGFDMNLIMNRNNSSDDEHCDEANESYKKILEMYPEVNKKRKRRRRR